MAGKGPKTADVCRKHGVSWATLYNWKAKYGGLEESEAKRLKTVESENARLKKLLADAMLDNAALNDLKEHGRECRGAAYIDCGAFSGSADGHAIDCSKRIIHVAILVAF
jgi:putative transposase